ncbi:MAG: hypothetical protein Q9N68_12290 [Gammaproteobacteria bacterium]|nr:hypothetical protein [Gammaproteobacteria bacterium]
MAQLIQQFDLSMLPEEARTELHDFYLFLKQRYGHSSSLVTEEVRHTKRLESLKVEHFELISRDDLYER